MKEYILFYKNGNFKEINNHNKYDYVLLGSVAKLITLFGFLDCINNYKIVVNGKPIKIKLSDKVNIIFPEFKYNYRFIDIINHKTQLENDWYTIKDGKFVESQLQKDYFKSDNINKFALNLKLNKKLHKFNYNNYTYNILAEVIHKLTGKYLDKYLENNVLKNVRYKWWKKGKNPHSSFGLQIHTKDCRQLVQNIFSIIDTIKPLKYFWNNDLFFEHNGKKYTLIGHDGSGGQYMYFNQKTRTMLLWFSYEHNNFKVQKLRTAEKYVKIYEKLY